MSSNRRRTIWHPETLDFLNHTPLARRGVVFTSQSDRQRLGHGSQWALVDPAGCHNDGVGALLRAAYLINTRRSTFGHTLTQSWSREGHLQIL